MQSENKRNELRDTTNRLENVRSKLVKVEQSLEISKMSKNQLELKHKKTCHELKTLKHDHVLMF